MREIKTVRRRKRVLNHGHEKKKIREKLAGLDVRQHFLELRDGLVLQDATNRAIQKEECASSFENSVLPSVLTPRHVLNERGCLSASISTHRILSLRGELRGGFVLLLLQCRAVRL